MRVEEAEYVRDMKGPDGLPFFDCPDDEARCGFAYFCDDFNAEGTTQRSESASYCVMGLAPLGLDIRKRYRSDFVFIFAIVPFPVPKGAVKNNFLLPFMEKMARSWTNGTRLSRTAKHRNGRTVRTAIMPMVMDLKARHEMLQAMQAYSGHFCTLCDLHGIHNFGRSDFHEWRRYTSGELKSYAEAWLEAGTAERERLYKERGFRWTALWTLPYFDPTRQVVVDGMHTIFLRLAEHHCRRLLHLECDDTGKVPRIIPPAFELPIEHDSGHPEAAGIDRISRLLTAAVIGGDEDDLFEAHLAAMRQKLSASAIHLAALAHVANSLNLQPIRQQQNPQGRILKQHWINALVEWVRSSVSNYEYQH